MRYESKKVLIIIISMILGFILGRSGDLFVFNQNQDAARNKTSKFDRNLIDQIYSMNIIFGNSGPSQNKYVKWPLIIFLTTGGVSKETTSFDDTYYNAIKSAYKDKSVFKKEVINCLEEIKLIQFSTTIGTDRIQGFANDVSGKIIYVFPGKNPYIIKFLNSNSVIDVESASEEFSSLFF